MQNRSRYYLGVIIFVIGFASPLAIPLVLKSGFSDGIKTILSGALAIGGPEVLMILASVIMGKENLTALKAKVFAWFKPLAPPEFVSKTRFYVGVTLFSICLLESVVHLHWNGIILWYADFALPYMIFWNVVFLISLYILGGDFFNRLIGLFSYKHKSSD